MANPVPSPSQRLQTRSGVHVNLLKISKLTADRPYAQHGTALTRALAAIHNSDTRTSRSCPHLRTKTLLAKRPPGAPQAGAGPM